MTTKKIMRRRRRKKSRNRVGILILDEDIIGWIYNTFNVGIHVMKGSGIEGKIEKVKNILTWAG